MEYVIGAVVICLLPFIGGVTIGRKITPEMIKQSGLDWENSKAEMQKQWSR